MIRSPLLVAILAATAPLFARATEWWPGFAPCALCLWQRWPYWAAAALALVAAALPGTGRTWLLRAAALAVLSSGAVAVLHVGVEQGWWPSPLPSCQAPLADAAASVDDLMRSLSPTANKPCDQATYLIQQVPLSLAAMNLIYAVLLAGWTLWVSRRRS